MGTRLKVGSVSSRTQFDHCCHSYSADQSATCRLRVQVGETRALLAGNLNSQSRGPYSLTLSLVTVKSPVSRLLSGVAAQESDHFRIRFVARFGKFFVHHRSDFVLPGKAVFESVAGEGESGPIVNAH